MLGMCYIHCMSRCCVGHAGGFEGGMLGPPLGAARGRNLPRGGSGAAPPRKKNFLRKHVAYFASFFMLP
jgi:hypothetical protein